MDCKTFCYQGVNWFFFFFFKDGQEIQGGKDGHLDKWGSEHLNSHMRKEPKPISHYYKY